jgi:hypothetical protein
MFLWLAHVFSYDEHHKINLKMTNRLPMFFYVLRGEKDN